MRDILLDHLIQISAQQLVLSGQICHLCTASCYRPLASMAGYQFGYILYAVFFDYKKAFHSVPHRPLIEKLKATNINSNVLRWIAPYLTSRTSIYVYVCVNGASSHLLPCPFQCAPGISYWPLPVYLVHERYYLNLTVRWHPYIVCG